MQSRKLPWTIWRPSCVLRVKFRSCTQNAKLFLLLSCFSLPDNCDQFQVPLQGIFALNVLWWVISSSAVRMGRSVWRFNSSWNFFVWIDKIEYFFLHWNIAFFSLKYSKGKFPLLFCSEKWRTTAEIQGKSNDSLLFT